MTNSRVKVGILAAVVFLLHGFFSSAEAMPQKCTREEAIKAETGASSLKTWNDVFSSYRLYKQCDDGAISEGYSASVANLLAAHWNQIGDLAKLSASHPEFEHFVLRHVDETMSLDQGNTIKGNIRHACPMSARHICSLIKIRFVQLGSK